MNDVARGEMDAVGAVYLGSIWVLGVEPRAFIDARAPAGPILRRSVK